MAITMELYELKNICKEMAALGAATIVQSNAPSKDLVSQREAYRLFQEMRVRRCCPQLKAFLFNGRVAIAQQCGNTKDNH